MDLTRELFSTTESIPSLSEKHYFSEPPDVPEEDDLNETRLMSSERLHAQLKQDLEMGIKMDAAWDRSIQARLDEAVEQFCEPSDFPEATLVDEVLSVRQRDGIESTDVEQAWVPPEEVLLFRDHMKLQAEANHFSEPSDFPEATVSDEAFSKQKVA